MCSTFRKNYTLCILKVPFTSKYYCTIGFFGASHLVFNIQVFLIKIDVSVSIENNFK